MGSVTLATWNVDWMTRSDESHRIKVDYLAGKPWDLIALQKATHGLSLSNNSRQRLRADPRKSTAGAGDGVAQ